MPQKDKKTTLEILEPFLIVGVFALVIFLGYQFFFQQQLDRFLPGGSDNTETIAQNIQDRKDYLAALTRFDALYQTSERDTSRQLSALLPVGQGVPEIFARYETMAATFGLNVQSIDIVNDKSIAKSESGGVQSLLISVKLANTSYEAMKKFLDRIEKDIRIADIQSISFDPRSRFVDLSIRSYYRAGNTSQK